MRIQKGFWLLVSLAAVIAGCTGSKSLYPEVKPDTASAPPKSDAATALPAKIEPVLELKGELAKLPESLQHDAAYYYSLTYDKPLAIKYKTTIVAKKGAAPETSEGSGTISTRLTNLGESEASFVVDRSDSLTSVLGGQEQLALRKDGLYAMSLGGKPLDKPVMELPSDLSAGKTWESSLKTDIEGSGYIDLKMTNRIIGTEKIATQFGDFDALKIESSGTMSSKDPKTGKTAGSKTSMTQWMVKGVGVVKMTLNVKFDDGKEQTTNLELVKPS